VEYGKGFGSSKKIAKSEAARLTLEFLIPEFKKVETKNGSIIQQQVDESVSLLLSQFLVISNFLESGLNRSRSFVQITFFQN
jgi:hypothetical protein